MGNNSKKNTTTRFLICSFIGLLVLSIIIFSLLGAYMVSVKYNPTIKKEPTLQ